MRAELRFCLVFIPSLFGSDALEAQGVEKWNCVVEDFKGFSHKDQEFIDANLEKKFILFVTPTEVLTKVTSDSFEDSEKRYTFVSRDSLAWHGKAESVLNLETISIASNPQERINEVGYFQATVSIQTNILVNSWLLRCLN